LRHPAPAPASAPVSTPVSTNIAAPAPALSSTPIAAPAPALSSTHVAAPIAAPAATPALAVRHVVASAVVEAPAQTRTTPRIVSNEPPQPHTDTPQARTASDGPIASSSFITDFDLNEEFAKFSDLGPDCSSGDQNLQAAIKHEHHEIHNNTVPITYGKEHGTFENAILEDHDVELSNLLGSNNSSDDHGSGYYTVEEMPLPIVSNTLEDIDHEIMMKNIDATMVTEGTAATPVQQSTNVSTVTSAANDVEKNVGSVKVN